MFSLKVVDILPLHHPEGFDTFLVRDGCSERMCDQVRETGRFQWYRMIPVFPLLPVNDLENGRQLLLTLLSADPAAAKACVHRGHGTGQNGT